MASVASAEREIGWSEGTEIVRDIVPNCEIGFAKGASADKRNYRVDCNLLPRVIHGYKPQWTVRRGVEQLYEAYRRVGLALDDFEGPKYKRIDHVKQLRLVGNYKRGLKGT